MYFFIFCMTLVILIFVSIVANAILKKLENIERKECTNWKPSEVQIKYLDVAIAEANGHKSYNLANGLEKLKNDLLKL